jgi:hypothetical protein
MSALRALGETRGENFMNDATAFSIHFRMSATGNQFVLCMLMRGSGVQCLLQAILEAAA